MGRLVTSKILDLWCAKTEFTMLRTETVMPEVGCKFLRELIYLLQDVPGITNKLLWITYKLHLEILYLHQLIENLKI